MEANERISLRRRIAWALAAACVLSAVDLLSYPLFLLHRYGPDRSAPGDPYLRAFVSYDEEYVRDHFSGHFPAYAPAEWVFDHTPLRALFRRWAAVCGVSVRFDSSQRSRALVFPATWDELRQRRKRAGRSH